jgi:hypothetical protein
VSIGIVFTLEIISYRDATNNTTSIVGGVGEAANKSVLVEHIGKVVEAASALL